VDALMELDGEEWAALEAAMPALQGLLRPESGSG
jgi:hypothetical protein